MGFPSFPEFFSNSDFYLFFLFLLQHSLRLKSHFLGLSSFILLVISRTCLSIVTQLISIQLGQVVSASDTLLLLSLTLYYVTISRTCLSIVTQLISIQLGLYSTWSSSYCIRYSVITKFDSILLIKKSLTLYYVTRTYSLHIIRFHIISMMCKKSWIES
jgi:hypothetical protein